MSVDISSCLTRQTNRIPNGRTQIHARLGELQYMAASTVAASENAAILRHLAESLKRFCRSIELCDDYLRGYYGLRLVSAICSARHTP